MLRNYSDITNRLGPPLWWDDNGCLRYVVFSPERCGIYDSLAALVEICCQSCGRRFYVAVTWDKHDAPPDLPKPSDANFAVSLANYLHYGDPPNVECCGAGATMDSVPMRVVEFWTRDLEWKRDPAYEIALDCDWA